MLRLFKYVTYNFVALLHDAYIDLPDLLRIATKQHLQILSDRSLENQRNEAARVAVIAVYPTATSLPFTINLLVALRNAGFYILVLSSKRIAPEMANILLQNCDRLVERHPIGRDFGSYQMGLRLLKRRGAFSQIHTLVLANDSMFYPGSFSSVVDELLRDPQSSWMGLFENYQCYPHTQSFFQVFRRDLVNSRSFQDFWLKYRPLSSRPHVIRKGEIALSRVLHRASFRPQIRYTSNYLLKTLCRRIVVGNELDPLRRVLHATLNEQTEEQNHALNGAQRRQSLSKRPDPNELSELELQLSIRIERRNPTHSVGLLANYLCGAPIKRDIAYRGTATIGQMLQLATGYSDAELSAMEADLRERGTPAMFRGLKRVLYNRGRI